MRVEVQNRYTPLDQHETDGEPLVIHQHGAAQAPALVILVHGFAGRRYGKRSTWGRIPEFLFDDLEQADIGLYWYDTGNRRLGFGKSIELDAEAEVFGDLLRDLRGYSAIVIVGHSMGGLLAQAAIAHLVDGGQHEALCVVRGVMLMATPQAGSLRVPRFLWRFSADARALRPHGDLVTRVQRCFDDHIARTAACDATKENCIHAWAVVAKADRWVDKLSAAVGVPSSQIKNVRGSHTSIVKPQDKYDDAYTFVLSKLSDALNRPTHAPPGSRRRLIAFDLDGTLLRGFQYSWSRIWRYLGFDEQVDQRLMRRYLRDEITYSEWCSTAVAMFRERGLVRSNFAEIVAGITVTHNLSKAIGDLKAAGFACAIISGGVDTFLDELIPDHETLFDHVLINRLTFDESGLIRSVESTPYDFAGKLDGLQKLCETYGLRLADAVFVGEGFNDETVAAHAGMSIAYPPVSEGTTKAADVSIPEDDLTAILPHVL